MVDAASARVFTAEAQGTLREKKRMNADGAEYRGERR
jgi:hypothetical protein